MSFVIATMNQYGIAMTCDTKETLEKDGVYTESERKVCKIIKSDRCLVGFAGITALRDRNGNIVIDIKDIISETVEDANDNRNLSCDKVFNRIVESFIRHDIFDFMPHNKWTDLLIGCMNKEKKFRFSLGRYAIERTNKKMVRKIEDAPGIIAIGQTNCYPNDLVENSIKLESKNLSELGKLNESIYSCVLKTGETYLNNGIIDYFPVGGEAKTVYLF